MIQPDSGEAKKAMVGDVLRFADAAHHCFCSKAFLRCLPIACAAATPPQIGSDEARRYCVARMRRINVEGVIQ